VEKAGSRDGVGFSFVSVILPTFTSLTPLQILEGIVTFIVSIWAYFQIHNYPDTAKFLTEEERLEVRRRLVEDRQNLADEWDTKYIWDALKDWKIWVHMLITFGTSVAAETSLNY
jgi:hypothetical protein